MNSTSRSPLLALALLLTTVAPLAAQEPAAPADRPAQVVATVAPQYPYLMRRAEAAAQVTVAFKIDVQGIVTEAKVVDSNNPEFVQPTLDALKQWTFLPAIKGGKSVESQAMQTFTFNVRDQAESESNAKLTAKKRTR